MVELTTTLGHFKKLVTVITSGKPYDPRDLQTVIGTFGTGESVRIYDSDCEPVVLFKQFLKG